MGLRELGCIAPAARWASAAGAAPDLEGFVKACVSAPLPLMLVRAAAFGMLVASGVRRLARGQPEPDETDLAARLRVLPLHPQEMQIEAYYARLPREEM